ncbi:MAG: hypothetical protein AAGI11_22645 [Pseudomonadota bacterium]
MRAMLYSALGAILLPATAQAAAIGNDDWRVIVNFPMIWAPDIEGEVTVDGISNGIEIGFSDILENLEFGFIGELWLKKGRWGLGWRSMLLETESKLRTDATGLPGRPPVIGAHELKIDASLFTSDIVIDYHFNQWLGLYGGLRRSGTEISYRIRPLEDGLVNVKRRGTIADEVLFDWVAGIDLGYNFDDRWRAEVQADTLITGDNDSNRLINAHLSYNFNERHSLWFGYRYLNMVQKTRQDGSRLKTDFTQHGPTLGWSFTF